MHLIMSFRLLSLTLLATLLTGCISTELLVTVDGIAQQTQAKRGSFVLRAGGDEIDSGDLQFQEYAGQLARALIQQGYQPSADAKKANMTVFLRYGLGKPQTITYQYSTPIYGYWHHPRSYSRQVTDANGNVSTETVFAEPHYGVVGSQVQTATTTVYQRNVVIEAIDNAHYQQTGQNRPLWRTTLTSTGQSTDLRRIVPIMLAAGAKHFGSNTGYQLKASMLENAPQALEIRGYEVKADTIN